MFLIVKASLLLTALSSDVGRHLVHSPGSSRAATASAAVREAQQ